MTSQFERTGLEGKGSKTGSILGRCRTCNLGVEEENWNLFGRGRGWRDIRGRGFRFGWRRNQIGSSTE